MDWEIKREDKHIQDDLKVEVPDPLILNNDFKEVHSLIFYLRPNENKKVMDW